MLFYTGTFKISCKNCSPLLYTILVIIKHVSIVLLTLNTCLKQKFSHFYFGIESNSPKVTEVLVTYLFKMEFFTMM